MSKREIKIFPTVEELNQFAAKEFVRLSREAIEKRGQFTVALSGGSTPKKLFALLASDSFCSQIDWQKVQIFFGDERCALPDSEDSNFRMTNENLLSKVKIPKENIRRFLTEELNAMVVAEKMENEIRQFFELAAGEFPHFDLIFLGMGADGHTASLFPETNALKEDERIVVENYVGKFEAFRLTFTFSTINNARNIIFLISGKDKAEVLKEVLESEIVKYPSQMVQLTNGNLLFLLDEKAAQNLS